VLSVGGEVASPQAYRTALPQTSVTVGRVTVTVRGAGHREVTFALGELASADDWVVDSPGMFSVGVAH
jgi:hypothetical protein